MSSLPMPSLSILPLAPLPRFLAISALSLWLNVATRLPAADSPTTIQIDSVLVRIIDSVNLPAPESGVLESLSVREGSLVQQGDAVFRVDAQAQLLVAEQAEIASTISQIRAESQLALQLSEKNHALAKTELTRIHSINQRIPNTIPQSEVDRLTLEVERTALEIQQAAQQQQIAQREQAKAASEWRSAQHAVARRQILSPLDGAVVRIDKRVGEWVNAGETVLKIVRVNRLRAETFLPADLATDTLLGKPARLQLNIHRTAQHAVQGVVSFVDVEADPVNSQVRVWIDFDKDHPALRPGLSGTAQIDLGAASDSVSGVQPTPGAKP